MEKKGTRIAYFVALAIVVIALVIAKVANDGSGFVATGWALFPPIVAIALALISKEVYSSLFLGCVVGALLLANFQPWQMVVNFVGAGEGVGMINAIDISILIFLVILGIMVDLMNKAGGSAAFGRWAKKAVKTRSGAQLLTMLLGVLIFIDDYFNCLTVGAVMRPVTESHKISRAKLAYIIDATAAPICIIAPISSWAAAVGSNLKATGAFESDFAAFVATIPYNFYALFSIIMVVMVCLGNFDFGPMRKAELRAQQGELGNVDAEQAELGTSAKGSLIDMLLPIGSLIYLLFCVSRWGWGFDKYLAEANKGTGLGMSPRFKIYFQFILPMLILVILLVGLGSWGWRALICAAVAVFVWFMVRRSSSKSTI